MICICTTQAIQIAHHAQRSLLNIQVHACFVPYDPVTLEAANGRTDVSLEGCGEWEGSPP